MEKKTGPTFLMALGFFLISVSPLIGYKYLHILSGLFLVIVGYYWLKRQS